MHGGGNQLQIRWLQMMIHSEKQEKESQITEMAGQAAVNLATVGITLDFAKRPWPRLICMARQRAGANIPRRSTRGQRTIPCPPPRDSARLFCTGAWLWSARSVMARTKHKETMHGKENQVQISWFQMMFHSERQEKESQITEMAGQAAVNVATMGITLDSAKLPSPRLICMAR